MEVSIKDYEKPIHELKVILNFVDISVSYITCDLVHTTLEAQKKLGDKFSIKDAIKIQLAHKEKWEKYFKEKEKKK